MVLLSFRVRIAIYRVNHPKPIVTSTGQAEPPKSPKNSNAKQQEETINRNYFGSSLIYHHSPFSLSSRHPGLGGPRYQPSGPRSAHSPEPRGCEVQRVIASALPCEVLFPRAQVLHWSPGEQNQYHSRCVGPSPSHLLWLPPWPSFP